MLLSSIEWRELEVADIPIDPLLHSRALALDRSRRPLRSSLGKKTR